ncbi:uncharacterized protein B0H18DRAFT_952631 [Fomitopsis serialis]|uniref:uncharacterized protein n=1 Tax=Fomitopsis serialis TaxID=139415 RepID=UPI002008047C|nr:uncharacterized protein B0H18DRAFT_952631 [Neoantrodia serialis]KAH9931416.1 hypothetical protein B0H18DRAFT_952631 [Neoantrodia serialis]
MYVGFHVNLSQNIALRFLDVRLYRIEHGYNQPQHTIWTKAMDELHSILSTIRSRQLEHIQFHAWVGYDAVRHDSESEQPSVVLKELDLRDLHGVMSRPNFDTLKHVGVKMYRLRYPYTFVDAAGLREMLELMVRGILQPWSASGILNVTCY